MSSVWDDAPDERLLATTRAEPAAFCAFYRRHEDSVLSSFLARVGDREVAADLTAETFAAALASAHRFQPRRMPETTLQVTDAARAEAGALGEFFLRQGRRGA